MTTNKSRPSHQGGWDVFCERSQKAFLRCTTGEKKNGLLLIEVFSKLFNTQNDGHQGSILGGLLLFIRVRENPAFKPNLLSTTNIGG